MGATPGTPAYIGRPSPPFVQQSGVLLLPFLGPCINQLRQKLIASTGHHDREHRRDRLREPRSNVIQPLLEAFDHESAPLKAFGQRFPPGQQWRPILFVRFGLSRGLSEIHIGSEHAHEEGPPIFGIEREEGLGAGLGPILFELHFPPDSVRGRVLPAFGLQFQPLVLDPQHALALPTAEVERLSGSDAFARIRGLDHLELLGPAHDPSGLHGLPDRLDCDSGLPVV